MRTRRAAIAAASLTLLLAACSGGGTATPSAAPESPAEDPLAPNVNVTLQEWSVTPSETTAPAGDVIIQATNDGPEDDHELVVIKTDLDPAELPTKEDGSVDEEGEGIEVKGEIEEFEVGGQETQTFELDPGSYALICNVVMEEDDGTIESHYKMGMHTAFTVS